MKRPRATLLARIDALQTEIDELIAEAVAADAADAPGIPAVLLDQMKRSGECPCAVAMRLL